jgi:SH3-like domain-containing protein
MFMPCHTRLMQKKGRKWLGLCSSLGVCALPYVFAAFASALGPSNVSADPIAVGVEHCVVNVRSDDRLNMRSQPSAASPIVARKAYGSCGITVAGACLGSWCPVEDGHNRGWVHRHYIAIVSPARYCVTGVSWGDRLNVRAFPSRESRILTTLARNQCGIAFLPYAVGNWQKIRVVGWEGWANRRYLTGQ